MDHQTSHLIPDHELLRPIASGAYGEVWLSRSVVGTLRAVKIVRHDRHVSAESFEREFKGLQKFEPVSRAHDGLVDILTLGLLPDGAGFYYVMELADQAPAASNQCSVISEQFSVPGTPPVSLKTDHCSLITDYSPRTLRAELKSRGALPADEVIALGLKLTAALAHLHAHGLVHRDVKPSNILFIGGEPKLADAGLVAAVDDARSLVGTAGYIAPEGPGTPQADLYALGKVLYEAAFGKDRQEFPALPADVASRPDHAQLLELNAILLKACDGDSRERYQTADRIRADLELRRIAGKLKALVPTLAATYCAQAIVSKWDWNFPQAKESILKAIKSDPKYELAHTCYGFWLFTWGWPIKAREQLELSRSLAPSKVHLYRFLGHTYYMERKYTNALAWYRQAIERETNYAGAYGSIGETYRAKGDYTNAINNYEKCDLLRGGDASEIKQRYNDLRRALENGGVLGYWRQKWTWAEKDPEENFYWKARIQIHLGNTNAAFNWLNKSFQTHERGETLTELLFDQCWDGQHDDPQFKKLLDDVGFSKVMPPRK